MKVSLYEVGPRDGLQNEAAVLPTATRVAFITALFQFQHEYGVAIFFLVSLVAFTISLIDFAREVRIALSEFDHYA